MADLLTHVLVAYVILTTLGWRVDGVTRRWVVVGMGGAAIPDLVKINLLVRDDTVETVLGVPFSFGALSTLGGVLLVSAVLALSFGSAHRRRAYAFLVAGGLASLVGDGLRVFADGTSSAWLYPFTWWSPPLPDLYVSSDYRVLVGAVLVAGVVYVADSRFQTRTDAT